VRDVEGRRCDLRLTPYRTADNRIDGLVLKVLGLDELDSSTEQNKQKAAARGGKPATAKAAKQKKPAKKIPKRR